MNGGVPTPGSPMSAPALEAGPVTSALLRDARRCVRELAGLGSPDLTLARLAAGRVAATLAATIATDERTDLSARPRARRLCDEASEHLAAAAAGT